MYKPTVNHAPWELTLTNRKGRNTAWLHDNNRTIVKIDGQFSPLPTTMEFKTEPSLNNGSDVTEVPLSPVFTSLDDFNTKPTELNEPYSAKSHETNEPEPNAKSNLPNWFSLKKGCGNAITDNRENLTPKWSSPRDS